MKQSLKTLVSVAAMAKKMETLNENCLKLQEMELLNEIRLKLQEIGCLTFRTNVGKVRTPDGRWFSTGLPKGFSDLLCLRPDGVACFIETKLHPRKPTKEQCQFILAMIKQGCPAGVAFSVEDAIKIVEWTQDNAMDNEICVRSYLKGAKTK